MKQFLISLFLLSVLISCKKDTPVVAEDPSNSNPIAHYTFNGNSNDQSAYANNGEVVGATLTVDSFSTSNSAYKFNGASYIEIKDNDILDIKTNKLTVSAWIKPSYIGESYIIQKATYVNDQGQLTQGGGPFSLDIYPGKPRALIYGIDDSYIVLTGTSKIKLNTWQHLALTWDGNIAYLYYNGKLESSEQFSKQISATNGNLYIGAYKWAFPKAAFNGIIDNVRIYDRFLTTSEIQDIYSKYK